MQVVTINNTQGTQLAPCAPTDEHPIDFLWRNATQVMRAEMLARDGARAARQLDVCSCCERLAVDWVEPFAHVEERYGLEEVTCPGCQSLYHSSFELLGIQQYRAGKPSPMSLGMLTQGALIVREGGRPVFIGPPGWVEKFQTERPLFFDVIEGAGATKVNAIIDTLKQGNFPALIIEEFDKQKPPLVENLRISRTANRTYWASIKGCKEIDLFEALALADTLAALNLDKSIRKKWRSFLLGMTSGNIGPQDAGMMDFLDRSPELISISQSLPVDPYRRKAVLDLLRILNND